MSGFPAVCSAGRCVGTLCDRPIGRGRSRGSAASAAGSIQAHCGISIRGQLLLPLRVSRYASAGGGGSSRAGLSDGRNKARCRGWFAVAAGVVGEAECGRGCACWPPAEADAGMVMSVEGRMSVSICAADVNTLRQNSTALVTLMFSHHFATHDELNEDCKVEVPKTAFRP